MPLFFYLPNKKAPCRGMSYDRICRTIVPNDRGLVLGLIVRGLI